MNHIARLWSLLGLAGAVTALGAPVTAQAQANYLWVQQAGSPGDDMATASAAFYGDVFTVGHTTGQLGADPSMGGWDAFLVKHDLSGSQQWVRQLGSSGDERAQGVAVGEDGSIYVVGNTWGSLDGYANSGGTDIFLARYDAAGDLQWVRQLGSSSDDFATSIAVSGDGTIAVAGYTLGSIGGAINAGAYDVLVATYDAAGNTIWTRQYGTSGDDRAQGVGTVWGGDIYVAGHTAGALDGNARLGGTDLFLTKFDGSGARLWTRQHGNTSANFAQGLALDWNGNVYVAGYTWGALDGQANTGLYDGMLLKYDSSGARLWTRLFGTTSPDYATGVAVDWNGDNIYVAGSTSGASFLSHYDGLGNAFSHRQFGSGGSDTPRGVTLDAWYSTPYVSGYTWGNFPSTTSAGGYDYFLTRHAP
jgi:hypothetical protein